MKRCPQCNTVFDDSLAFCTNDGTPLVEQTFVLPSESSPAEFEEETVIRHEPIHVEIPTAQTEQFNFPPIPPTETIVVEKPRNTGKYALFMALGLLLGGGLVLAAVLFAVYMNQQKTTQINVQTSNKIVKTTPDPNEKPTAAPTIVNSKHETRTEDSDDEFNGRVIAVNAYVRASPSRESAQIDVLPTGDRLNIEERANENSPWYRVTCEHGTSGWMHGNTIEYTR